MTEIYQLRTEQEWTEAWPALHSLRSDLELSEFLSSRNDMISNGYELFGVKAEGHTVSVVGLTFYLHLTRLRECWIRDLATLESERSKGYGKQLLDFIADYAKAQGCSRVNLHTRLHREDAQRFYEDKAGFEKHAYVYKKLL